MGALHLHVAKTVPKPHNGQDHWVIYWQWARYYLLRQILRSISAKADRSGRHRHIHSGDGPTRHRHVLLMGDREIQEDLLLFSSFITFIIASLCKCTLVYPFRRSLASFSKMVSTGLTCRGESGTKYRLICPLGTQICGKWPNIWVAVNDWDDKIEYVAKWPPKDTDNSSNSYPWF